MTAAIQTAHPTGETIVVRALPRLGRTSAMTARPQRSRTQPPKEHRRDHPTDGTSGSGTFPHGPAGCCWRSRPSWPRRSRSASPRCSSTSSSASRRRASPFFRVVELTDETTTRPSGARTFPSQYDGYRRTVDQQRTRYGGSEAVPRAPTEADPRSVVAQSRLDEDPRLRTMWAGYAFAKDFREERGHAYMLDDQTFTERQQVTKQPGTCIHCHGSVYVPYKKMGGGDLIKGFEMMNQMPFAEARKRVEHPVAVHRLPRSRDDAAAGDAARLPRGHHAREGQGRASRTTTSTRWRRVRRCARTSAGSATSSTTSRARRSA